MLVSPQFDTTTSVICSKVCKSISRFKRHINIHNDILLKPDPVNPVKTSFVYHLCYRPCKSAAGLQSRLRTHGSEKNPTDENLDGNHLKRCCNHHVYMYVSIFVNV